MASEKENMLVECPYSIDCVEYQKSCNSCKHNKKRSYYEAEHSADDIGTEGVDREPCPYSPYFPDSYPYYPGGWWPNIHWPYPYYYPENWELTKIVYATN